MCGFSGYDSFVEVAFILWLLTYYNAASLVGMVEQLQCQSGVGVARILLGIPYCVLQNLLPQKQRSHGAEHFPY